MAHTQRYWDGEHWTDHIAPAAPPAPQTTSTLKIARGVALGLLAGMAALWFISYSTSSDAATPAPQQSQVQTQP